MDARIRDAKKEVAVKGVVEDSLVQKAANATGLADPRRRCGDDGECAE